MEEPWSSTSSYHLVAGSSDRKGDKLPRSSFVASHRVTWQGGDRSMRSCLNRRMRGKKKEKKKESHTSHSE